MMSSDFLSGVVARTGLLGFTAGLRSQMPLALLAREAGSLGPAILRKRTVPTSLYLAAAGELVGDKLPITPSRLNAGSLVGRAVSGALAGGLLSRRAGWSTVAGGCIGVGGAIAGSYAGYHARVWLGEVTGLPDPVWAVLEDGVAITLGSLAVRP